MLCDAASAGVHAAGVLVVVALALWVAACALCSMPGAP